MCMHTYTQKYKKQQFSLLFKFQLKMSAIWVSLKSVDKDFAVYVTIRKEEKQCLK